MTLYLPCSGRVKNWVISLLHPKPPPGEVYYFCYSITYVITFDEQAALPNELKGTQRKMREVKSVLA